MNQAIGRVIRHRRDFGCVVLCDARFAEERNRQSLSLWARPFVRECNGFGKVAADLTRFFKVLQLLCARHVQGIGHCVSNGFGTCALNIYSNGNEDDSLWLNSPLGCVFVIRFPEILTYTLACLFVYKALIDRQKFAPCPLLPHPLCLSKTLGCDCCHDRRVQRIRT